MDEENNSLYITIQTIGKICKALGCQADDIMEFFENKYLLKSRGEGNDTRNKSKNTNR